MKVYKCPDCDREYPYSRRNHPYCGDCYAKLETIEKSNCNAKVDLNKLDKQMIKIKEKKKKLIEKYKCVREYVNLMQEEYIINNQIDEEEGNLEL